MDLSVRSRPALILGLIAVGGLLLLAGCGGDDDDEDTTSASEEASTVDIDGQTANYHETAAVSGGSVDLEEDDYYFEPTVLTGDAGQKVTLDITNEGDEEHNFSIDDQNIDEDTEPGESTTVKAEIPDSGVIPFYCSYHESQNMRGALAVSGSEPKPASDSDTTTSSGGGY
jgi:plastocyanin